MNALCAFINSTGVNTVVTLVAIIIGVAGIAVGSGVFVQRRKRRFALIDSIRSTRQSIQNGRQVKMAMLEDFPTHKRFVSDLRPYLLRTKKIDRAMRQYEEWFNTIRKAAERSPLNILGADVQSEIDTTLGHLDNLEESI